MTCGNIGSNRSHSRSDNSPYDTPDQRPQDPPVTPYVVQGYKITDSEALRTLHERGLPETESAVEIPKALLSFAEEA
ncbi:hypothetical protein CEP50_18440 [Actinopolyspora mortivallis]|uniref:Uncharacterized protein n=1 Tax=Actinopolyspora mortivallis TaxID=33906 RepID=A0A2T0GRX5_ACTMO|nr:hypothetical protein CEP50_18440 [Actinopolyspora mortivallis]